MKSCLVALAATGVLLSGCASLGWDGAAARPGGGQPDVVAPPATGPAVVTIVTGPTGEIEMPVHWCQKVAGAGNSEAAREGFDAATRHTQATTLYRQCREISALAGPPPVAARASAAAGR